MILNKFKQKTRKIRHRIGLSALSILTPKLVYGIRHDFLGYIDKIVKIPRPFTEFLFKEFGNKKLIGAEIGFCEGLNTVSILEELNIKRLYCIEPFLFKPYNENNIQINAERMFNKSNFLRLQNDKRVQFIYKTSDEFFKEFVFDKPLDFIYIDGNHETDFCYRDIVNSLKVVKVGGFVGGHDFTTNFENTVVPAIFRFAVNFNIEPKIEIPDFWFKKIKEII